MKRRNFFTMIELLAAVALMVLLAGIGFAGYSYAMNSAKESATKSLIARIGAGLDAVRNKHGFYPSCGTFDKIKMETDSSGLINKVTFCSSGSSPVVWDSTNSEQKKILKTFLEIIDAETLKKFINKTDHFLEDSWGGTIYYCYPGKINTTKFDIVAPGADGMFGEKSVEQSTPHTTLTKYQSSGEWACDDIANFQ